MATDLTPGDGDPRHGTNGYSNLGCRCDVCRREFAALMLRGKAKRKARLIENPTLAPHGRASTYGNWACRCDPCREAWVAADTARNRRRKARQKGEHTR